MERLATKMNKNWPYHSKTYLNNLNLILPIWCGNMSIIT